MHATYLLTIIGAVGLTVSGSPLEARQELSDDETKALGVIKDKNLGDFCNSLLSNNVSKRDLDIAGMFPANSSSAHPINKSHSATLRSPKREHQH
ncbi:hypothetical protein P167DRAFT_259811 [Morchella conica CCBAS932]|uniref:Uncharacterized protein n=1 Tax=Morchella conica CCBAS932 TaxID=1392247 RepID=A0A3N4L7C0_9PEZI|nr:hypothetical protein P167DRAFT_259811 [Morchella conica CCBAS932]